MKWINAEQQVTVTIYDEEHEEHHDRIMTVEEMLDTYTNEGCPTMYSNPERKTGKWIPVKNGRGGHECDQCHNYAPAYQTGEEHLTDFCPNCGAKMEETECN